MIETNRDTKEYTVYCDHTGCQETLEIDTDGDWGEMLRELKAEGWCYRKDRDGSWNHNCAEHNPFRRN